MSSRHLMDALFIAAAIFLIQPNIFRGRWKETTVTQRVFPSRRYDIYMRILGALLIAGGLLMF
jgi:hypothetical protein